MPARRRSGFTRRGAAFALLVLVGSSLASCAQDKRHEPLPEASRSKISDIQGVWQGPRGGKVVLKGDGSASVDRLGGQEFSFDDKWKMSGEGKWELLDARDYKGGMTVGSPQLLRVSINRNVKLDFSTGSKSAESGEPESFGGGASEAERDSGPKHSTWILGLNGGAGQLRLYYLVSDPDLHVRYELKKVQ
ncbi:hypothetical protein [Streptomyces sp. S186]|uniref:hypothetical protein n=1 Tax=Streptomyces sp. S186 TaxID=3434395 RepID=UPI003F680579